MDWQFWIDVGGTFTDCVALSPTGERCTEKVLSSAATKGVVTDWVDEWSFHDAARVGDPQDFWVGYQLQLVDAAGGRLQSGRVDAFESATGTFRVSEWTAVDSTSPARLPQGCAYELQSGEDAPLLAIRRMLGLTLDQSFPPGEVRLGTTRGTNALLERKGARTAFVTTRGFGDVLRIANQDRPRLFDLAIRKPEPLYERTIEADERLDVHGEVLQPLDRDPLLQELRSALAAGIESLAVCLLHAWVNPAHELQIEELAWEAGFREISLSHHVSPRIKIVPRGDTTVVDAYLTPILREYVGRLQTRLGDQMRLRLMTSAGGLVSPERFTGRDSILSGPAGGVIGFSRIAERAGFPRSIGFDMGGTSTDVARYDGVYDYEYETVKAGVRVAAPMLAIETVAAGGGSICGFDGVQLFVGPESAGADPGPACYGRGGPLTVTDVNLALGKLPAERFPFPLDRIAVERRLAELCDAIARSPLGKRYEPLELAEGFVRLANVAMTRAIRNISVAKGCDPAEYALVTFGGAGGQHACAIADALRMRSIVVHPLAGVLSAYGIGIADVRRQAERPVLELLTAKALGELEGTARELAESLRAEVVAEGIADNQIERPRVSLDLRYRGVESVLTVPRPADGDFRTAYERQHERVYGYRHAGRDIEIAALRVEVIGRIPDPPALTEREIDRRPTPSRTQPVRHAGAMLDAAVFDREEIRPGDTIAGPAILCEPTSTLVIDPGWTACVTSRGEVLLGRTLDKAQTEEEPSRVSTDDEHTQHSTLNAQLSAPDPVTLEVFNNHFASIAEQMGVTLQRTAISTNVKERLDFSCAVFDAAGRLVVNAPHIPVHLGAMSETVQAVLADNPDLRPGDVVVTNDPYRGGSHLPDVTVVTPVHAPQTGELLFLTASRAHHAEIGGIVPGSVPPFSRNLAEEGVLIRNFRLVDAGISREDDLRSLLLSGTYPSRNVEDNLADVAAQAAANRLGARLLLELVHRYGHERVRTCMRQIREAAAVKMRRALVRQGSGVYERVDFLDDGSPIAVRVTIDGEAATIDFTGTGPVLATNLNANRAIVTAAVMYVFRCLIDEDIPLNSGVLEPLSIVVPECLLNPPAADDPRDCPAIVGGNVETSQRVVDVLLGALGLAAASQGTMNNLALGDERFGYYETICGGSGATADANGADAVHTHMTNTRLTDVEVLEHRYPLRVEEFRIRAGSGGAGNHRGGDGVIRRLEFLRALRVSMLS
ncbi:MAG: hydantoinase B/oxoprolinase family protein, partial [Planctomycetaceae bacterium]|nr:hydantoinase B/oxoprolinase family protein [Planctomycetaceae bacterium]